MSIWDFWNWSKWIRGSELHYYLQNLPGSPILYQSVVIVLILVSAWASSNCFQTTATVVDWTHQTHGSCCTVARCLGFPSSACFSEVWWLLANLIVISAMSLASILRRTLLSCHPLSTVQQSVLFLRLFYLMLSTPRSVFYRYTFTTPFKPLWLPPRW